MLHLTSAITLRKATASDKQLVAKILVSAFAPLTGDNSINFVVKQDDKRLARMHILMEYLFERSMRYGVIYLSNNDKTCILLKTNHKESISLKSIKEDIRLVTKCIGITRVIKVLKRQRIVSRHYPNTSHIKPVILGALQDAKGSGNAARLLLQVDALYKENTLPVIVDAADMRNVRLYEKFGFRVVSIEEALGFPVYFLQLN